MRHFLGQLVDMIAPDTCILCELELAERTDNGLCHHCTEALPSNDHACRHCALPISPGAEICGRCASFPFIPDTCTVPLIHNEITGHLVRRLKFQNGFREARCLGTMIAQALEGPLPQVIIPVPLAYLREVRRGYNQSLELANVVGKHSRIPVIHNALSRRHGPRQRELSRRARRRLSPAEFQVKRSLHFSHVAVIDDVMTTGSTALAVVKTLKSAGVERVDVWCATRAVLA